MVFKNTPANLKLAKKMELAVKRYRECSTPYRHKGNVLVQFQEDWKKPNLPMLRQTIIHLNCCHWVVCQNTASYFAT